MRIKSATLVGGMIAALTLAGLTSCNLYSMGQLSTINPTEIIQTAVAIMTEQSTALTVVPGQPVETPQPEVITPTTNPTQGGAVVTISLAAPTATTPCELVSPGTPLDVTIPDDTRLQPGETFTKIWRLVNSGSCTWDERYAIIWFSGDELGVESEHEVQTSVPPSESLDIDVEMVAPESPGVYTSYWMLRSERGVLFGLGPNGNAPFWVKIQVVAVNTATPTATVEPTATPRVEISGEATLANGQSIDLDSGMTARGAEDDLYLSQYESNLYNLEAVNNARMGVYGMLEPSEVDCRGAVLATDPIPLDGLESGVYLCYRTNQGLPGTVKLIQLPVQNTPLEINYLTWAAP